MTELKGNNDNVRIPVGAMMRCRKYFRLAVFFYFARQTRPDFLSAVHYGCRDFNPDYTVNKLIYFLGTDIMCLCFAYALFEFSPNDKLFRWAKAIFWTQVAFQVLTPYANPVFANDWFKVHIGEWLVLFISFIHIYSAKKK